MSQSYVYMPQNSILYPGEWMSIKIQAAECTRIFFMTYIEKKINKNLQEDSSDDDALPGMNQNKGKFMATPETPGLHAEEVKFIQALPYNIPLELGFSATPSDVSIRQCAMCQIC